MSKKSKAPQRHLGFVMTCQKGKRTQYIVRVKDPNSSYNGQKFHVTSVRDDLALSQGLNVNFCIGTMDGKDSQKIQYAVDVILEMPSKSKGGQSCSD